MGTLLNAMNRARIRARDVAATLINNDELLLLVNGQIATVHDELINLRSTLIQRTAQLETQQGVPEYIAGFRAVSVLNACTATGRPLVQVTPGEMQCYDAAAEGAPQYFALMPARHVILYPTPDDIHQIQFTYYPPVVELVDIDEDDFAYDGIFNRFFEDALTVDILGINERDITYASALMAVNFEKALNKVFARRIETRRTVTPDMFMVEGL